MPKLIQLAPNWGLGNRFFGFLLARSLQMKAPNAFVEGYDLADWGQCCTERHLLPARTFKTVGHVVPIELLARKLRSNELDAVYIGWLGARVSYYEHLQEEISSWFVPQRPVPDGYGPRHLVISIRLAETLAGVHADYGPLPLSFYSQILDESGLSPVFFGQIGTDVYSAELRRRFPGAEFVCSRGPLENFETLRRSSNILLSVSTFCWMAAWLARADAVIWMPCAGFYNQRQRPDQDLMPARDPRYRFYEFPVSAWHGTAEEIEALFTSTRSYRRVERDELAYVPEEIRRTLALV